MGRIQSPTPVNILTLFPVQQTIQVHFAHFSRCRCITYHPPSFVSVNRVDNRLASLLSVPSSFPHTFWLTHVQRFQLSRCLGVRRPCFALLPRMHRRSHRIQDPMHEVLFFGHALPDHIDPVDLLPALLCHGCIRHNSPVVVPTPVLPVTHNYHVQHETSLRHVMVRVGRARSLPIYRI